MRSLFSFILLFALATPLVAQEVRSLPHNSKGPEPLLKRGDVRGNFVLDTVRSAVAIPQDTDRDRLRVLRSAAEVVRIVDQDLARRYARQAAQLESSMVARGETPDVTVFGMGLLPCADIAQFVQGLPVQAVGNAQEQLTEALQACPRQLTDPIRNKVTQALDGGVLAPQPLLQLADKAGANSRWAQATFSKVFSSLPSDSKQGSAIAGDLASLFSQLAPSMDHDAVQKAGLDFLEWLGKLDSSETRNAAVGATVEAMQGTLGADAYERALESNPTARSVTQVASSGAPEPPAGEPAEMHARPGDDDLAKLQQLPPPERARQAASRGFTAGTSGDRQLAGRYFDLAYSALNDVWSGHSGQAADIVAEVNDAAAQVDPVAALNRAQRLDEPGAQAIGMISVARVVASHQLHPGAEAQNSPQKPPPPSARPRR